MSIDTVGVVVTPIKDAFLIAQLVQNAFNQLIESVWTGPSSKFRKCIVRLHAEARVLEFKFTFDGEDRKLQLFTQDDEDYSALGPQSLSLRLGAFGSAELLMHTALYALSILGPTYIELDDSRDDAQLERIEETAPTVLQLVRFKYWPPHTLDDWVKRYDAQQVGSGKTFEDFFGFPGDWFRESFATKPYAVFMEELSRLAKKGAPRLPQFLQQLRKRSVK